MAAHGKLPDRVNGRDSLSGRSERTAEAAALGMWIAACASVAGSLLSYHRVMEPAKTSAMILEITNPDLTSDPATQRAVKDEKVLVEFADMAGELVSSVGVNRYAPGDALIKGSTGDRWSVSRDRFDVKYDPEPPAVRGESGYYRNRPVTVLAKRIDQSFTVARTAGGDILRGESGDWLIQYAPGDFGIVDRARFKSVYRLIAEERR